MHPTKAETTSKLHLCEIRCQNRNRNSVDLWRQLLKSYLRWTYPPKNFRELLEHEFFTNRMCKCPSGRTTASKHQRQSCMLLWLQIAIQTMRAEFWPVNLYYPWLDHGPFLIQLLLEATQKFMSHDISFHPAALGKCINVTDRQTNGQTDHAMVRFVCHDSQHLLKPASPDAFCNAAK